MTIDAQNVKAVAMFATRRGQTGIDKAYSPEVQSQLSETLDFVEPLYSDELSSWHSAQDPQASARFREVRYIFSTWGMPELEEAMLEQYFPSLEAVFYAGGTVQPFARPFLNRGIRVFSAWEANAIPVAEYTLAQIILSGKRFFHAARLYKEAGPAEASRVGRECPGNYDLTVGLLGCGAIGALVAEYLKGFRYKVLAFDPFLSEARAAELGVTLVSLPEVFSEADIVSNHLANNAETVGMLDASCFDRLKRDAVFINTGRGAQVVEDDLVRALESEPLRQALLDVTWPEPVQDDHPFLKLDNCVLTPHIAGSLGAEIRRMGEYMFESFSTLEGSATDGRTAILPREVTLDMLEYMA